MLYLLDVLALLKHIIDNDSLDAWPNACFFSGASMSANRILSGLLSCSTVKVSPSAMPTTAMSRCAADRLKEAASRIQ
jgi:hypothetical protein